MEIYDLVYEEYNNDIDFQDIMWKTFTHYIPRLYIKPINCPHCECNEKFNDQLNFTMHLNDDHEMSWDRIVEWLEKNT